MIGVAIDRVCGLPGSGRGLEPKALVALELYEGVVRRAAAEGLKGPGLVEVLVGEHGVGKEEAQKAAKVFDGRAADLRAAVLDHAAKVSGPYLQDLDWKVKVVLASSQSSSMRQPLLELALYVGDADGRTREHVLELDGEELDRLIGALQSMRQATQRIPY